jgi:hypothetical protein
MFIQYTVHICSHSFPLKDRKIQLPSCPARPFSVFLGEGWFSEPRPMSSRGQPVTEVRIFGRGVLYGACRKGRSFQAVSMNCK